VQGLSEDEKEKLASALPGGISMDSDQSPSELASNSLVEGIVLSGEHGDALWSNDFFMSLDEGTRGRIRDVCSESSAWFRSRVAEREVPLRELVCRFDVASSDGAKIYEVYVTPAHRRDDEDHPCTTEHVCQVAAVVRDVTQVRRRQLKMEAIDRAGYELVRLDADAVRGMNSMERLALVERKIVRDMHELLHYDHFAVFLIDNRTKALTLVISIGLPNEIQHLTLIPEAAGSGISGYVASTGRSYICTDAQTDDLFLPGLAGARSSLTVPLLLHDQVIGIIDIESQQPRAFDEEDRRFVEIFARHIALALHMLDLLVAERCSTNENVTVRVEGELNEPLDDILHEVDWLREIAPKISPETAAHIERIRSDVEAIRTRVKEVAAGPQTLLGVDRALADRGEDPLLTGRRVLVADDAPKIRKVIAEVLRCKGCVISVASSGEEAIEMIRAGTGDGGGHFDLVVSDIQMPDRNGYEVFSAAKDVDPGTPVILMTGFGYDPHHSIVRASQVGLGAVIFKPFEIEVLLEQVRKALNPEQAEG
jgi:CheY-like chemotaxis protein/putative methionine-R-sulfoxide reductase with GAF domain